jgi:hypothetical protein
MEKRRDDCFSACYDNGECTIATFLGNIEGLPFLEGNCLLYDIAADRIQSQLADVSTQVEATSCIVPRTQGDEIFEGAKFKLQGVLASLLASSAILGRFASFFISFIQKRLMRLIGYGGAELMDTILWPRLAARAASRGDAEQGGIAPVPQQASWDAIVKPCIR